MASTAMERRETFFAVELTDQNPRGQVTLAGHGIDIDRDDLLAD